MYVVCVLYVVLYVWPILCMIMLLYPMIVVSSALSRASGGLKYGIVWDCKKQASFSASRTLSPHVGRGIVEPVSLPLVVMMVSGSGGQQPSALQPPSASQHSGGL